MSIVLSVENLCKKYKTFELSNVSFSLSSGEIMGFIGRNGAGKTTTIKSILNLVHSDGGEIVYFGMNLKDNESEIKTRIGYASGGVDNYIMMSLKTIVEVTKRFYINWDDEAYKRYMKEFNLDENKKVVELSQGMRVKFNLALALSHKAELLILDEPTSGLDPVSREELLLIFKKLAKNGVSILFSTHITSDLDKCANKITYIREGKILASTDKESFKAMYDGKDLEEIMLKLELGDLYNE